MPEHLFGLDGDLLDTGSVGGQHGVWSSNDTPGFVMRPSPFNGQAADLDGAEFIDLPTAVVGKAAMSMAAWVKFDSLDGLRLAISGVDGTDVSGTRLYLGANGSMAFARTANNAAIESGALTTGQPHHLALTYTASETRLYVDGIGVGSSPGRNAAAVSNLSLGAYSDGGSPDGAFFLDGQIWDVRFYDEELDATAILELSAPFNAALPENISPPAISATGRTLSVSDVGAWTLAPNAIEYQWQRDGSDLPGETAPSYQVPDQYGGAYRLVETASNGVGSTSAVSNAITVTAAGSVNLVLTMPAAHHTFQRLTNTSGSILIEVDSADGEVVEGRFTVSGQVEGAWTTLGTVVAGTLTATLENQPVGRGRLEVRLAENPSVTDSATEVGIGDVFVGAGQSNSIAEGRHDNSQTYAAASPESGSSIYDEDAEWRPVSTGYVTPGRGAGDYSIVPRLATKLEAAFGVPIGFVLVGEGGTRLNFEWTPAGGAKYAELTTQYAAARTNGYRAVLWDLGESDAIAGSTLASFQSGLSALISSFRVSTGTPEGRWIVAITGTTPGENTLTEVRSAQSAVILGDDAIWERAAGSREGLHWGEGSNDDSAEDEQLAQLWVDAIAALAPPPTKPSTWWRLADDPQLVCRWSGDGDGDGSSDSNDARRRANARWLGEDRYTNGPFDVGSAFHVGASGILTAAEVAAAPRAAAPRTLCFWVAPASDSQSAGVIAYTFSSGAGERLSLHVVNNEVEIDFSGHRVRTTGAALSVSQWKLVSVVVPEGASFSDDVLLYVGTVQNSLTTISGEPVVLATGPLAIQVGGSHDSGARFDGQVWDVRVYGRALAEGEIGEILRGPEPTPIVPGSIVLDKGSLRWSGAADTTPATWDAHGNGELEVLADVFVDGTPVATGVSTDPISGASLDVSAWGAGAYEVVLAASNAGGLDPDLRTSVGPVFFDSINAGSSVAAACRVGGAAAGVVRTSGVTNN